jgi:hypothetical protein
MTQDQTASTAPAETPRKTKKARIQFASAGAVRSDASKAEARRAAGTARADLVASRKAKAKPATKAKTKAKAKVAKKAPARTNRTSDEITALLEQVGALMARKTGASRAEICERLSISDQEAQRRIFACRHVLNYAVNFNRADGRFYAVAPTAKMRKALAAQATA